MRRFFGLMTVFFATCLVGACQTAVTDPCDVLPRLTPKPTTNQYIVQNDREFAQQVAMGRGRYQHYKCGRD